MTIEERTQLIEKQRRYQVPSVTTYYQDPIIVERGQGRTLIDRNGSRYLYQNIVRVSPSLTVTQGEIDEALRVIEEALQAWYASVSSLPSRTTD